MPNPKVSVVIATRNRPKELARLLKTVREQAFDDFECIVVDDGSSEDTIQQYDGLWRELDDRFQLTRRPHPGGPGAGRNTGISLAKGQYVAFCDDDDYWTRSDHLGVAARAMDAAGADLFVSNMQTSREGIVVDRDWYGLHGIISAGPEQLIAGESDVHRLKRDVVASFLRHRIFPANTLVVARELLAQLNSYWEKISFCEDLDLAFRLADRAGTILYRSTVTADADVGPHISIGRSFTERDRVLFGITAALRAETLLTDPGLRKVARGNRAWRLLELAGHAVEDGRVRTAWEFAVQSVMLAPSRRGLSTMVKLGWTLLTGGGRAPQ
ncbi:glycosyltransferase family 2 protein [Sphingomonas sp. SRS2]|uniref:glycosyltransferase family 2 protein n=1 Tax=Sphingomonas sp. SRS2 TaxID=133190 RepID=UPI0006989E5C|nr:glycosyltransferase family 2 protein [Sphingomonas sp. SRS2]